MRVEHLHETPGVPLTSRTAAHRSRTLDRWALARIASVVAGAPIRFSLWDGYSEQSSAQPPVVTVTIRNRRALLAWLWDPELNFGEAYMREAIEVSGDLRDLLRAAYAGLPESQRRSRWLREAHDVATSRDNVHAHYDLGNDFYRLWLDEQLQYTCAVFPDPAMTLEAAQVVKMDRVCRKLWLQPGDRVVEAGCGWGSLAIHMARDYGVNVVACNVSREQIEYARRRAFDEGVASRVQFVEDDYRNLSGRFDVFVSVGMLEHVGLEHYEVLGQVIDRTLKDSGRGLLHFIGRDRHETLNAWIRKRIFPGAYPPTLSEACGRVLEPVNLSVLDVENLRRHYARTLEYWFGRYERHVDCVAAMFDEAFARAWRLYLAGSQVAFETGTLQLFQVLFARHGGNRIPWTRYT